MAILDRLKHVANAKINTQLALILGLKYSSVSSVKSRGVVPAAWIINATSLFNVSVDWLIFGDERFPEFLEWLKNLPEPDRSPDNK